MLDEELTSTIYVTGRIVSAYTNSIERLELYILHNTDVNVMNGLWNLSFLKIYLRSNFENTSYTTRENQS